MEKLKIIEKRNLVRKSIIEAAKHIFTQAGYDKASLNMIANKLGKGKSTLYYYFKNKEEIFKAVLLIESESIWEHAKAEVLKYTDPRTQIKTYILTRMKAIKNKINYSEALRNDMLKAYEFISKVRQDFNDREQQAIKSILDYGVTENIFTIKNTGLTAEAIAIALRGFEMPLITDYHSEQQIEEEIDELLYVLFNGMLKKS